MRIEIPRESERLGAVQIYGLQRVYELDAGPESPSHPFDHDTVVQRIASEAIYAVQEQMAIVVPVRNERLKLIEGVLVGIPHPCLVIVVSNSPREPVDRHYVEHEAIQNFCKFTRKQVVIVHQKDPVLAEAFRAAGYEEIIDDDGLVRDGKAEGMIMGTLIARMLGRRYVGFVDSDNYLPGAVYEYVREYAAGFVMNNSDYALVRICWHSKPKIVESALFFAKWGRSSVHSNRILNKLLSAYTGFETEVIKTGNAGEHALTVELAMQIAYATGYAVETFHFVHLFERFGGILPDAAHEDMRRKVRICQIESRNPHLHESKGDEHVEDMISASLNTVYHSRLCPEPLKREIENDLTARGALENGAKPAPVRVYPSLAKVDVERFTEVANRVVGIAGPPFPGAEQSGRRQTAV